MLTRKQRLHSDISVRADIMLSGPEEVTEATDTPPVNLNTGSRMLQQLNSASQFERVTQLSK